MRILFLSSWYPYPPDNGSRIRVFNLIKQLSRKHDIALLSFSRDGKVTEERLEAMQEYCFRVQTVPLAPFKPGSLRSILGFFSTRPRSFVDTYSLQMRKLAQQAKQALDFSAVIASQIITAPYAVALDRDTPRIFEEVELTTFQEKYTHQSHPGYRMRYGLMWWKTKQFTTRMLGQFDGCTVVSQQERANVLSIAPNCRNVAMVPNGVDLDWYKGDFGTPRPSTLVFPGALTYDANFDAMEFFLYEVFPLVKTHYPEVKLRITGKKEGVPIEQLPLNDSVILTGYLADIRPTVAQSWACVVPLRVGGGTRLKVLEAMALGTPVISTSKGAEGLDVTPNKDILIADEPTEFAQAVIRLLDDPTLRTKLSANARSLLRERYGWGQITKKLDQLLHQVVSRQGHQATE